MASKKGIRHFKFAFPARILVEVSAKNEEEALNICVEDRLNDAIDMFCSDTHPDMSMIYETDTLGDNIYSYKEIKK